MSLKYDWYQTETTVVITVLIKDIKGEQIEYSCQEDKVNLKIKLEDEITKTFKLFHKIIPEQCSYKITPSKIEIKLKKLEGLRWSSLELPEDTDLKLAIATPSYPTSKDWAAIERELFAKEKEQDKPEGEDGLNALFQEIYGKGSDEVKKAMNKSFMESGGTVLSTNWQEVGKDKVKCNPPDGVEFKKWDS